MVDVRETEEKRTDVHRAPRRDGGAAARRPSSLIKAGTEEDGEQQAAEDELLEERRDEYISNRNEPAVSFRVFAVVSE